jgi:CRISPR-associated endonuclease/helicase Cas3
LASAFAADFAAADWGKLLGWYHDLGKYSPAFQRYLRQAAMDNGHDEDCAERVDHSSAGAQYAIEKHDVLGHLLAYALAGHHSGLLDSVREGASQEKRLNKELEEWQHGLSELPELPVLKQFPPQLATVPKRECSFAFSLFVRMLFSCLTDADFLDTEAFMNPEQAAQRPVWPDDILARMEMALAAKISSFGAPHSDVDRHRAGIHAACLARATDEPGLFSLTVPTGGGKTLSSLAFALRHARIHGLKRVVYVIPFTSIIEQNAQVFREVFADLGEDVVLEHHSNFDPEQETTTNRLATENWDAPLVVTTAVQFFESLFANRTSRCRKLHNLARAVVILDEAQTLPVGLLTPCLAALRELARGYGSSLVLCTATQPAVKQREGFPIGFPADSLREIIPDPTALYNGLRRCTVTDLGKQADAEIAERLRAEPQVLCIVNTRRHARLLFDLLGEGEGNFHLSAQMCPAHRLAKLAEIRLRLDDGVPCRVISTQLIEAGVDIDFPVVFRSRAGIDSIAQAAGRCNRNGKIPDAGGRVFVFESEHTDSERYFADTADFGSQILRLHADPLSLPAVESYFQLYYWGQSDRWDSKLIMHDFSMVQKPRFPFLFDFAKCARDFQLIENTQKPVIIPWGEEGHRLCERLRAIPTPPARLLRQLQRYTVQIPKHQWCQHIGRQIELIHDQYPVLISPDMHYSDAFGLDLEGEAGSGFYV